MKTYSVHQLAQISGLTNETIRYYRNQDLLHPIKNENNGYYEYSELDALQALNIKRYRNLGWSFDKIQNAVTDRTPKEQADSLHSYIEKSEKEIVLRQHEIHHSREVETYLRLAIEKKNQFEIFQWNQDVIAIYLLGHIKKKPDPKLVSEWVSHMPYTYPTLRIPKDELEQRDRTEKYNISIGLAAIEESAKFCSLPITEDVRKNKKGLSVRTFLEVSNPFDIAPESIREFREYVYEHNFHFLDDSSGWILAANYDNKVPTYLVLIRVAIG